jgi:hypothetical protein
VRDGGRLDRAREVFGDDRADYGQALQRHYNEGPPADWQERYVSTYATAHPWEDFAETWRTTCTSWTRWRRRQLPACVSGRRWTGKGCWRRRWISIPTSRRTSRS